MTTTTMASPPGGGAGLDARLIAAGAFLLGLLTIGGAWGSQIIGGLYPCELCLEQRWAYYVGLPVLLLVLLLWRRLSRRMWMVGMGLTILAFVWSMWMSGYHAGVEWGFWPGPTACTGLGVTVDFSDLQNIDANRVVPCDQVQFRLFGLSLAGYNFLISTAIVALLALALGRGRGNQGSSSISQ